MNREGENGWHTGMTQTPSARITQTSIPLAVSYLLEVLTIIKTRYIEVLYTTAQTATLTAGIQWYEDLTLQTSLQQGVSFTWSIVVGITQPGWRKPDNSNPTFRTGITQPGWRKPDNSNPIHSTDKWLIWAIQLFLFAKKRIKPLFQREKELGRREWLAHRDDSNPFGKADAKKNLTPLAVSYLL